jgi:HSP20 family molecular chaperone IbpA
MKAQAATAAQPDRGRSTFMLLTRDGNMKYFAEIHNSIARRAFEIYEHEGKIPGRDLENWFRAEAELLHPVDITIADEKGVMVLRAEVPGFNAQELAVRVEPTRLSIAGRRAFFESRNMNGDNYLKLYCAERIYRVVDLPATVDPARTEATLGFDVLELRLPKASRAFTAPTRLKAA